MSVDLFCTPLTTTSLTTKCLNGETNEIRQLQTQLAINEVRQLQTQLAINEVRQLQTQLAINEDQEILSLDVNVLL